MLLEIDDDAVLVGDQTPTKYMVVQRLPDGHRYVVAGARIFSSQTEASLAWQAAATAFDLQVSASSVNGALRADWRPQLVSFSVCQK